VFSENERSSYQNSEPGIRQQMFFDAWSRKEAVLKACGHGLRFPLRKTEVSLASGEPDFMVRSAGQRWHVRGISLEADYACAVAAGNEFTTVTRRIITIRHPDDILQHSCS
jgi:4'-phosphopantetheinyl transferase